MSLQSYKTAIVILFILLNGCVFSKYDDLGQVKERILQRRRAPSGQFFPFSPSHFFMSAHPQISHTLKYRVGLKTVGQWGM